MTRRRLYNPAQLTPEELAAAFVARRRTLADMLRQLRRQAPDRPLQHLMLIGARGMGKTTLGLRFLHEIEATPSLAAKWQPVPFHEESYGIGDLADFWLTALDHLARATGDSRWSDRAADLARREKDAERRAAYARAALLDFRHENGKRPILFVENLDAVIAQMRGERAAHGLRASLMTCPDFLLIGSATTVFHAIRDRSAALYEFFRLIVLEGLDEDETLRLFQTISKCEERPEIPEFVGRDRGRIETIRRLTGGNPRLLALACQLLIESPLGPAFEDLERLIDEQTPYFKARIEELPVQARKVFHCLAEAWAPVPARAVAAAANLSSSQASAQLGILVDRGYVREARPPGEKRFRYEVADRFYNIYYLLRFSRAHRRRLKTLVAFLHDLFGSAGMRATYSAPLDPPHSRGGSDGAAMEPAGPPFGRADGGGGVAERGALDPAFPHTGAEGAKAGARCADRASEPHPGSPDAAFGLFQIAAARGDWKDALPCLERCLDEGGEEFRGRMGAGAIDAFIRAAAAGHARWVERTMAEAGLTEAMEPLWRAVRAELGEKAEAPPAEIADATADVRSRISAARA